MTISQTTTEVIAPVFSPLLRQYTLEEFWALPDPEGRAHYDLIGGTLVMVPPPDPPHGDVDSRLNRSLITFLNANGMPGDVHHPREGIYVGDTYIEPDMMYVSNELRAKMGKRRTSADIVFEYLSRSTANYDRTTKADTYLALGVRELWLLDSELRSIEIRSTATPVKGFPVSESRRYGPGESAYSPVLVGWQVSIDTLFAGL